MLRYLNPLNSSTKKKLAKKKKHNRGAKTIDSVNKHFQNIHRSAAAKKKSKRRHRKYTMFDNKVYKEDSQEVMLKQKPQ